MRWGAPIGSEPASALPVPAGRDCAYDPAAYNGMAVASLALGIVWIFGLGSILALVLGYLARIQSGEAGGWGDGLAAEGFMLGWIGLALLFIGLTGAAEADES
jgi:hypothetical protein